MENDEEIKMMKRQIQALEDDATGLELISAHFRPEFEACWERKEDGSMGPMKDADHQERALQLRELVLSYASDAKYKRKLAGIMRALAPTLSMPSSPIPEK